MLVTKLHWVVYDAAFLYWNTPSFIYFTPGQLSSEVGYYMPTANIVLCWQGFPIPSHKISENRIHSIQHWQLNIDSQEIVHACPLHDAPSLASPIILHMYLHLSEWCWKCSHGKYRLHILPSVKEISHHHPSSLVFSYWNTPDSFACQWFPCAHSQWL